MKYFVNAPKRKRRKSRKRRTAAQNRATAKMIAANKRRRRAASKPSKRRRTTRRSAPVAKRRRRRGTARRAAPRRRRRSTKVARRSPVTRLRRGRVYVTNPRKRRRRGYSRNPNIVRQVIQMSKDTGAVLAGSALGGVASGFLPDLGNPIANAAKGVLVAVGVRMAAARFLGADTARFAAAGAMQVPLKNLVIGFLPADQQVRARALLGDYGDLGAYAALSNGGIGDEQDLGAYTTEFVQ